MSKNNLPNIDIKCLNCKNIFSRYVEPKKIKGGHLPKYCSVECFRKSVGTARSITCSKCAKEFFRVPSKMRSKSGLCFCSRRCKEQAQSDFNNKKFDGVRPSHYGTSTRRYGREIKSIQEFKKIVKDSFSIAEALRNLGMAVGGVGYKKFKDYAELHNIDYSHFVGEKNFKWMTRWNTRPLKEVLVNSKLENTNNLKKRLIQEGIKDCKCEECCLTKWLGLSIPLELHHVDGNKYNNLLSNLLILCPNCHSRTLNYRGRNIKPKANLTGVM